MAVTVQFRIRFLKKDDIAVGPGKINLLASIAETGSISAAARQNGMSYRRAWMLVATMNKCCRKPVVTTITGGSDGGGACVTPVGIDLIKRYRRVEACAAKACAREIAAINAILG
jgi:molybdate transport system regulatory protein